MKRALKILLAGLAPFVPWILFKTHKWFDALYLASGASGFLSGLLAFQSVAIIFLIVFSIISAWVFDE